MQQVEMCHTTKKAQSIKRRIQKFSNQGNRERPEQRRTRPDRNHGSDPGPEPNQPHEGGGQGDPPRVRAHPGAAATLEAANRAHLSQAVACCHA